MRSKRSIKGRVLIAVGALAVTIVSSAGISQADILGGSRSVEQGSFGGAPITLIDTTGTGISVPGFRVQLDNDYPLRDREVSSRSVEDLRIVLDPKPTTFAAFRLAYPSGLRCASAARVNRAISATAGTSVDTKVTMSWRRSDASGSPGPRRYAEMNLDAPVPGTNTPALRVCVR